MHLAAEAVDEHERRARTFIDVMDAGAVDFDETAARRQRFLDPPRRPCGENGKAADHGNNRSQA
jgi:hypothetical protein